MNRLGPVLVAAIGWLPLLGPGQSPAATPYRLVEGWGQLPHGAHWGVMSWVDTDASGRVFALQRDDPVSKVMVFEADGRFVSEWAEGVFPYAHSLRVLDDGFVWVTDRRLQQVVKFTTDGRRVMAIGLAGVVGDNDSRTAFNGVSDVAMAPDGSVLLSDGEGGNARVVRFSRDGAFEQAWGSEGNAPGQFKSPHCVAVDALGRIYVCDRGNRRIQVFEPDGTFIREITAFGAPAAIAIGGDGRLYVAAGAPENAVTIGTVDGSVVERIEGLDSPHGIAVDPQGALYVAESGGHALLKFVRR